MYGISHCTTVQKARKFLEDHNVDYEFVDFKAHPPSSELILQWKDAVGDWPINRTGLTFRALKNSFDDLSDEEKMVLIQQKPSLIRRPVLTKNAQLLGLGFSEKRYLSFLAQFA